MADALWRVMVESGVDVADMLIFLPSRRAVRTVEKMIAERSGGVAILPRLVALGEGVDDEEYVSELQGKILYHNSHLLPLGQAAHRPHLLHRGHGCLCPL